MPSLVPEPSLAEQARTLMLRAGIGWLSTLSRKHPGWPYGSVMPYALDEIGRPAFLISAMAVHTQNLMHDPRASLLVVPPESIEDPLPESRATLMGKILSVPEEEEGQVRKRYLAKHPKAEAWVDFDDFLFHRMEIFDIYFVKGFGYMDWITVEEYRRAETDPLTDVAPGIIKHMNEDHRDALLLLAKTFGAKEAVMASMDRLGFHLRIKKENRPHSIRIAFDREVRSSEEARAVLIDMVRKARRAG